MYWTVEQIVEIFPAGSGMASSVEYLTLRHFDPQQAETRRAKIKPAELSRFFEAMTKLTQLRLTSHLESVFPYLHHAPLLRHVIINPIAELSSAKSIQWLLHSMAQRKLRVTLECLFHDDDSINGFQQTELDALTAAVSSRRSDTIQRPVEEEDEY